MISSGMSLAPHSDVRFQLHRAKVYQLVDLVPWPVRADCVMVNHAYLMVIVRLPMEPARVDSAKAARRMESPVAALLIVQARLERVSGIRALWARRVARPLTAVVRIFVAPGPAFVRLNKTVVMNTAIHLIQPNVAQPVVWN